MVAWMLMGLGCATPDADCTEDVGCGLGSVCVDGSCVERGCATSDQCGIEQYCSADQACVSGCEQDTDCMYGDYCSDDATCVAADCADTRLDCDFGEFCSPAGECYHAAGYYCQDCETDTDCGGNGNYCLNNYCGVECTYDNDCPAGYDCLPLTDFNGNIVTYQCWTYCWLYEETDG